MLGLVCSIFVLTAFFVTLCLSASAAWSDLKRMQIENNISVVIAISYMVAWLADIFMFTEMELFGSWWSGFAAGLIMFVLTFLMFTRGMLGGGDSKLASALALWVGLKGLLAFIYYMSIVGGLLALIAVINKRKPLPDTFAKKLGEDSWPAALLKKKNALPYGIAIFLGSVGAFLYTGLAKKLIYLPALVFVAHP